MTKETFEQMARPGEKEVAYRMWLDSFGEKIATKREEAFSLAAFSSAWDASAIAIRDELAKGAVPIAWHDECGGAKMVSFDPMAGGDPLYTFPPSAAARIAELEKQLNELNIEFNQCSSVLDGAERQAETLEKQRDDLLAALKSAVETIEWMRGCTSPADDEIEKAINEGNTVIANVKGES